MTPVLVAGAGPVGLALAVELSSRGVACTLVDPGDERRGAPRAKLTNVRSMEHFRRWGLAEEIRAVAPLSASYSTDICFLTRLTGHLLWRFTDVFATSRERRDEFPEPAQQIPQYLVEDVLRTAAEASPLVSTVRGRVTGLAEDEHGVTATVGVDGETRNLRAEYVVGCDGGRSTVREAIGASLVGNAALAKNLGIVFRSPGLHDLHPHGPALHYWLVNADAPSFMGPLDGGDVWWLIATAIPADRLVDREQAAHLVRDAVGAQVDVEILGLDPWQAHRLTADRVRTRRVFLAGDAAHLHPPFGAHGMNMGLGDAVDIGWKLAATLDGWGGVELLPSYEHERQPLHERVVAEAVHNNARVANTFVVDAIEAEGAAGERARAEASRAIAEVKLREFSSLGLVLGHSFGYSPLVTPDGTDAPPQVVTEYTPSARPGSLLPHAWLDDGRSLYDTLGPWFTLVDAGADADRVAALCEDAAASNVPLVHVEAPPKYDTLSEARLLLVRPDRIVAWRDRGGDLDAAAVIARTAGRGRG